MKVRQWDAVVIEYRNGEARGTVHFFNEGPIKVLEAAPVLKLMERLAACIEQVDLLALNSTALVDYKEFKKEIGE